MAFKSFSQYQEDKNGEFFVLTNDQDTADVVFLYRSAEDVLVGDVHYITSSSYKGFVHCCKPGDCPACNFVTPRGGRIRLDHKIFIPLYNITKNKIEFWDRSTYFEQVLQTEVFRKFPSPSEVVFRITRQGKAGSRDTRYLIQPIGRNPAMSYEKILADFGMTLPDGYSRIVKEMSASEMSAILNDSGAPADLEDYGYVPVPRGGAAGLSDYTPASTPTVSTTEFSAPPTVAPPAADLPDYSESAPIPLASDDSVEELPFTPDGTDDTDDSLDNVDF